LHPEAKKALRRHVEDALNETDVKDGLASPSERVARPYIQFMQAACKQRPVWLQQLDAMSIFHDSIDAAIESLEPSHTERNDLNGTLVSLVGANGISAIGGSIADFVESLPRTYEFSFLLPQCGAPANLQDVCISSCITLGIGEYPFSRGLLSRQRETHCREVRITTQGFFSYHWNTSAGRAALATEPLRLFRRLFSLSHAAMADSSSC
jgi:hypothetical protein